MESLPITSIVASILAIVIFILTSLVSKRRVDLGNDDGDVAKFVFGDGDDETLRRRIRAFGNFVEYVPHSLIMLALIEFHGASNILVWSLGLSFTLGRIFHAVGMLHNPRQPLLRIIGMFATYAILLVPAGWIIYNAVL